MILSTLSGEKLLETCDHCGKREPEKPGEGRDASPPARINVCRKIVRKECPYCELSFQPRSGRIRQRHRPGEGQGHHHRHRRQRQEGEGEDQGEVNRFSDRNGKDSSLRSE